MAGFASGESVDTSTEMAGFAAPSPGPPASAHRDPGGQQIAASRRTVHTRGLGDPSHRPAQAAESKNLLLLLLIQDVAHSGEGPWPYHLRQRLGGRQLMAGFAVSINGWIWVSTEARSTRVEDCRPTSLHGLSRTAGPAEQLRIQSLTPSQTPSEPQRKIPPHWRPIGRLQYVFEYI